VNTLRGTIIYTVFATVVFLGIQWWDGVRDVPLLAVSGAMFLGFTFFMLRLIQRLMPIIFKPREPKGRQRNAEPGPATFESTTDRPEHARRRREARRPRGRRR
jgi:TRAP-type C4-dicarboxylate transport system permease small subunit